MDYNKYIKKLISLNLISVLLLIELFSFLPFVLQVKAATIPVYAPVEIKEFVQTDWAGGWWLASSTDTWVWNKYNVLEWATNLDTSGWSLKLKAGATVDKSYPTYNIIHQAEVIGNIETHDSEPINLFDWNIADNRTYWVQWAPVHKAVWNFIQDRYTDPYFNIEWAIPQSANTTEGLYYSMKVTLKKSTSVSKIRFNLYDNDGRKFTRYAIKWSNDDINYSDIVTMPDDISTNYSGWQDIPISNITYKYFKFYFDWYQSLLYTQDIDGDVTDWDKQNFIHIKELEIYDAWNVNIAKVWWNVLTNRWPSSQQTIISTQAGWNRRHEVNTAGWLVELNTIDLLASRPLSWVNIYLAYPDIRRYFGYKIEVSNDNITWTTKIDRTAWNADVKWYIWKQNIMFSAIENWRYIKISGWKWAFSPDLTRWNWGMRYIF